MATCEVAVVGGGPAGAVVALQLARMGRHVVLCEAAAFPRPHVGVSLSPGMRDQLAFLGLAHLLDSPSHRPAVPIARRWEGEAFAPVDGLSALLADRGALDEGLLDAARRAGVAVLQPARVVGRRRAGDRWRLDLAGRGGSPSRVEAGFVIDATGRETPARRLRQGAPTLAVWSRWHGQPLPEVRISARDSFWAWAAPAGPDATVGLCFVDPRQFRRLRGSLPERYDALLRDSGVLPNRRDLAQRGPVSLCDATPVLSAGHEPALLRVGDADAALDPLSSSGVQAAVQSALAAAPVVNTLLSRDGDAAAALSFWAARRAARMAKHVAWGREHCRPVFARLPSRFWAERCGDPAPPPPPRRAPLPRPDQGIALSDGAALRPAPCIAADRVTLLPCVCHPDLDEPIAFVGALHVPPLLRQAARGGTAAGLVASWASAVGTDQALSLLSWAWQRGIVTAARDP